METIPINETEMFSNPIAPMEEELPPLQEAPVEAPPTMSRLTNADFRKLLMTPRVTASKAAPAAAGAPAAANTAAGAVSSVAAGETVPIAAEGTNTADDAAKRAEAAERRRKRKMYYAKLKRHDRDGEEDLSAKYRDRAKERRDGKTDYQEPELLGTTADYRAVAPTAAAGQTYAERRRQAIQESKYLGGDMQHTHLVKGLDYALLEKMRTEIHQKEREEDELDELEEVLDEKTKEKNENIKEEEEAKVNMKTASARNIYRVLFRSRLPDRNELFQPGRMAYRFELEEDFAEFDVPTTVIRSKAELPQLDGRASLTTNEIVIQKLTQIFSYLRAGRRQLKRAKLKGKTGAIGGKDEEGIQHEREKPMPDRSTASGIAIYDGIDDYVAPGVSKRESKDRRGTEKRDRDRERDRERDRDRDRDRDRKDRERERDRDRERDRRTNDYREHRDSRRREEGRPSGRDRGREAEPRRSYFDKVETEEEVLRPSRNESARDFVKEVNQRFGHYAVDDEEVIGDTDKHVEKARLERIRAKTRVAGYDECYPGLVESYDAMGDSDDEADYTKMDMGNKKGPVGRWDFESQEDYSRYMSSKEALPKAAFQYGVKMQDGRRTRRAGPKDEKAELNRQWQQIQSMMNKRKEMGDSGGPESKSRRY